MRIYKIGALGIVLLSLQILWLFFRGTLDVTAAFVGIVCGVLLGVCSLRRWFGLARKDIFVDKGTQRERKMMFFLIFPLIIVFGASLPFVLRKYFPELDIKNTSTTAASFFILTLFLIDMLGIYALERRYGRKFYIMKLPPD